MCATSVIFKEMPKVNNHPTGENSPNLVTLLIMVSRSWHSPKLYKYPNQGCQIFLVQHTKTRKKIPNDYKIYQMTPKYTKLP
jgi:hypothetical protein